MLDRALMRSALDEVTTLRTRLLAAREQTDAQHPRYQSLLNLKQYLILRSSNWTKLQEKLFRLSLSSLGRSYAHVAASVDTLYDQLSSSLGEQEISAEAMAQFHHLSIEKAIITASRNSQQLFGGTVSSELSQQCTAVMVTLPSHAAHENGALIHELADTGVNVFRINTAHDNAATWRTMADTIAAINKTRSPDAKIKIAVDLAGPKIRTGKIRRLNLPVELGSNKREKPLMIYNGNTVTRAESVDPVTMQKMPARLNIEQTFFQKIGKDSPLMIIDANGKKALLSIVELSDSSAMGVINKKISIDPHTELHYKHHRAKVSNIESQIDPIRLFVGDRLIITEKDLHGRSAVLNKNGEVLEPAIISCGFSGIGSCIAVGENVFIDDGKIGLEVVEKSDTSLTCIVTHAKAGGTLLKEEKGINFPDSYIKTAALTPADRDNLLAVLDFADHLSLSFCQNADDVRELQHILNENGRPDIGIIAKIETRKAISKMPEILEQLLAWEKSAVMIARGDLAIEVGFRNMASIQETLLDICNAAHMPVIWATQVLESQMKNNFPSRAEVTDAAMAGRAECVMLNKGAFAIDTIDVLTHILNDMHSIFKKNRQLLKKETLWQTEEY